MSLFGLLATTARSLDAPRYGLDVVGNNLANVNTAGYTRRVVDVGAVLPVDHVSAGNGVEVLGIRAQRDRLFDHRLFDEAPLAERQAALPTEQERLGQLRRASDGRRSEAEEANLAEAISEMTRVKQAYDAAIAATGATQRLTLLDYLP